MSEKTTEEKQQYGQQIARELSLREKQVNNVLSLTAEGNTVPFIARYRKEQTAGLDEVQIQQILDRAEYIHQLETRKQDVARLITEQGKMTEAIQKSLDQAEKLQTVEDIYRPYKQKRKTRASKAKEKGLEPLAEWLKEEQDELPDKEAVHYLSDEVTTVEEAIQGALDILAEQMADEPKTRQWVRKTTFDRGMLETSVKDQSLDEKERFGMYYDYEESVKKIVAHRVLAVNRGEKEGVLKVSLTAPQEAILEYLYKLWVRRPTAPSTSYLQAAAQDAYKRLLQPAVERDIRKELSEKAEKQAIDIFAKNLRNLLLQPPLKGKVVLSVDPAFRTGCKLAVVDETGRVLYIGTIFPHKPVAQYEQAKKVIQDVLHQYNVDLIAIGNGTASRETEAFISEVLKETKAPALYCIVNEAGASVYSASALAREEFPDLKVEERSAASIARRIQDPLAELVKIDPKSVGVGQYQHDVSQKELQQALEFIVETVVNQVGVNVNTASASLLSYVAGLSPAVAKNIVQYREENGKIKRRDTLKSVPRLGAKTYEQCIGFLRINDGDVPLDRTSIHPESYHVAKAILEKSGCGVDQLGSDRVKEHLAQMNIEEAAKQWNIGTMTLKDIMDDLMKPSRDPRDDIEQPLLKKGITTLEDLEPGMEMQGTIRNVVDFGAFVDIGLKQDGLVHISKLKQGFVKHPMDVVEVGDVVTVWVETIDKAKGRVGLSMVAIES
ncbi:RNA-binding transcriptional accessory protein [Bacillaceae bacterium SIJ1]|uniref:Tex family protein n=1 Tax=Litoribacterium kuwaitense TaxID=1398745 RepID=UPI0013EDDBA7|nr:Tex family protein [Litoribacterium kuwaitense]NGP46241.1 RNA-binding transcriptional accessory protein [Litoribacterium kuwaitense]